MATTLPEDKITVDYDKIPDSYYTAPTLQDSTYKETTYNPTYATAPELNIPKAETPNYEIDYNDEKLVQNEFDKKATQAEYDSLYQDMINSSDKYFQDQIDETKAWADKQSQLQQDRTDFTIEQIEQQRDKAHKDYIKEQSGAYVDWQKQSNQYGVNAEQMASQGLTGTGFSESSQVAMYNAYQNRVATAREVFAQASLNYDNAIKDAQLQNNSILAEIAHNALQEQLELSLQGFQYKNNLVLEQANKKLEIDNMYYQRYLDRLNQINEENRLAEEVRQYNTSYELEATKLKEETKQWYLNYNEQVKQWNAEFTQRNAQFKEEIRQYENNLKVTLARDTADAKAEAARLKKEIEDKKVELEQWKAEMKLDREKLEEQKRQFDETNKKKTVLIGGNNGGNNSNNSLNFDKREDGGNESGTYPFDKQSVINAGYAAASEAQIARDVINGKLTVEVRNGKTYIYKVNNYTPKLSNYLPLMQYTSTKNK